MKNTIVREFTKTTITLIYSTDTPDSGGANPGAYPWEIKTIGKSITQEEYVRLLNGIDSEIVMFADGERMALSGVNGVLQNYQKDHSAAKNIGYWNLSGKNLRGEASGINGEPTGILWIVLF